MKFPHLSIIEEQLEQKTSYLVPFSCAVLRNTTIEELGPYLRYVGRWIGFDLRLNWGNYDNILQEASGRGSGVIDSETRLVLVSLWLPAFSELFGFTFSCASDSEINAEIERIQAYCQTTIRALRELTTAPILWLAFEPPAWPSNGIADAGSLFSQRQLIRQLNDYLLSELNVVGNAWLVDTAQCLERVGAQNYYDWRYWHMAHFPFSRTAMAEMSVEIGKYIRALAGKVSKCLVLDCDNTLWGGIIGEVGINGICIGNEHPGATFRDFQLEVLNLYNRGVILAVCSKNNEKDVLDVFQSHMGMILREEHFAIMRINWQDKASNLREIASELNIGLDSMVFVDDSEFEINLVQTAIPEVETLHMPTSKAAFSRSRLASCGLFDTIVLTEEDKKRSQSYRDDVARKALKTQTSNLDDYLESLRMCIVVEHVGDCDLERAAQLCQRTNQFNLSTKRYTRDDLIAIRESSYNTLHMMKLSDRFGNYGTVGICIIKFNGSEAIIDTFLMSCRILGREAETAFLAICANEAISNGAKKIKGCYIPTKKNAQVYEFLVKQGFLTLPPEDDKLWFELELNEGSITIPSFFSTTATIGDS
jgi:FkbH-like protein